MSADPKALQKVTITRLPSGTWDVCRERADSGERATSMDLDSAWQFVRAAYNSDGSPRDLRRGSKRKKGDKST